MKVKVIDLEKADEIDKLPRRVGQTPLSFSSSADPVAQFYENDKAPCGKGFVLSTANTELIRLPKKQFLVRQVQNDNQTTFWGGYDGKHLFLTEIESWLFDTCKEKGFNAFYDALKPEKLKKLEKRFRVKSKRQGEFYFLPLPFKTLEELSKVFFPIYNLQMGEYDDEPLSIEKVNRRQINTSRHFLTGRILHSSKNPIENHIVTGTVTAPDHPHLKLGKQPHFIFNQEGLANGGD